MEKNKPKVIKLQVVSLCFHDMYEMTKYPRSWYIPKPELPIGTELEVKDVFNNFYGEFYRCAAPNFIDTKRYSNATYDIPVYNAVEL